MENGPYTYSFDKLKRPGFNLTKNPYSWNNNASVLYIDFPLGIGFSFQRGMFSQRTSEYGYILDLDTFMMGFMQRYPQFKNRDVYIAGEGMAGHFIPVFAKIVTQPEYNVINLKGVLLGNGWVDPFY